MRMGTRLALSGCIAPLSLTLGTATAPAAVTLSTTANSILTGSWTAPASRTSSVFAADATTLVSYGAADYRFHEIAKDADPGDFFATDFDDSAWDDTGQAPFGSAGECNLTFATPWGVSTRLLLRRNFTVPADTHDVEVHVRVDNDVTVYVNGEPVPDDVPAQNEGCASQQNVPTIHVPDGLLETGTDNLLAVHALDRGGETHLDVEVTGVVGPLPVDVTPPVTSGTAGGCGDDTVRVTVVDEDGGSGPKAVRFKIDGGSEQTTPTAADGTATIPVPEGSHEVEYRGEDQAGNLETATPANTLTVLVDRIGPEVTIVSDQGKTAYAAGEPASITVTASDGGSGLDPANDPTVDGESISTGEPGEHVVAKTARDLCGNETTQEFHYTVAALAARPELTIERVGSGTVSGSGIGCGPVCTETYDAGTVVTLEQVADDHWRFVRWEGVACAAEGPCDVTMDTDRTVTAVFERIQHKLTVELAGAGAGSVASTSHPGTISCLDDCEEIYDEGALVTLHATSAAHSRFAGWSLASCGSEPTCVVPIDAARTVEARFDEITHRLTIVIHGSGTVTLPPVSVCSTVCARDYAEGEDVTITATPATGWRLKSWANACSGQARTCALTMNAGKGVLATFEEIAPARRLSVTIVSQGHVVSDPAGIDCRATTANGTTCGADFADGQAVTLRALEDVPGHRFVGWGGPYCSGNGPCQLTLTGDRFAEARYEPVAPKRRFAVLIFGRGRVTSSPKGIDCVSTTYFQSCREFFDDGIDVTLTPKPATGYRFTSWSAGNTACRKPTPRDPTPPCTQRMSAASTGEIANFEPAAAPRPAIGQTGAVQRLGGTVLVSPPDGAAARSAQAGDEQPVGSVPLSRHQSIPVGSTVDATKGALRLTVQNARGRRDTIDLSGGIFVFRQVAGGRQRGRAILELAGTAARSCTARAATRVLQRLKASGGGAFAVRTRASESTSRRATWTTEDRCGGTRTNVSRGSVKVRDLAKRRTVTVRAGRRHLAGAGRG